MISTRSENVQLAADTVGPVARGHPWVYQDGLVGRPPAAGTPVRLRDSKGAIVGFGLADEGPIAIRVLGREVTEIPELLRKRRDRCLRVRSMIGADTDCYRLFNGEGDALPGLIVDRYADILVLRLYSRAWEPWLPTLVEVLSEISGVRTLYRRLGVGRVDGSEGGELLWGAEPPDVRVVQEHGMKLLVRVKVGQKTGLFLDQREHRRMVRGWSADRTVTNLFSYNGGFSVAAALGGARRVISVDQSAPALEDAKEIFRLNGIDPDKHGFEAADVFRWSGKPVDLLICDPPSLARSRDEEKEAKRAYRDLHAKIAPLAKEFLVTSSCTARLSYERWEEVVREGLRAASHAPWAWLIRSGEPLDHPVAISHPEGRYLKFALLSRL